MTTYNGANGPVSVKLATDQDAYLRSFGEATLAIALTKVLTRWTQPFKDSKPEALDTLAKAGDRVHCSATIPIEVSDMIDAIAQQHESNRSVVIRNIIDFSARSDKVPDIQVRRAKTSGYITLRVKDCLLAPDSPEDLLDSLVEVLLAKGTKIHERDWFRKLQEKHPIKTRVLVPTVEAILKQLDGQGWVDRQELIKTLFGDVEHEGRLIGALSSRFAAMVKAGDLEERLTMDKLQYRLPVPEPMTDEANIMRVLVDEASRDWVNKSYLCRHLYLTDADQMDLVFGRLFSLTDTGRVATRMKNGERQWKGN